MAAAGIRKLTKSVGTFSVLLIGLSIGSLMLCIFAGVACEFFPMLAYIIARHLVPYGCLIGEIVIYIASCLLEAVEEFIKLCVHLTPFISRGFRHLYNSFPYVMNDLWHHLNQTRADIWNFIRIQSQWLIFCWGLVLASLFAFSDRVRNVFRGVDELYNEDRNRHEIDDGTEYDEDVDYGNGLNDDRRNQNIIGGQNLRNRQGNGNQRLYPELPDVSDNSDNDIEDDYVLVGDQNGNLCIVCYENSRNTAVFPCGHTQTCDQCMINVMRRTQRCPLCQRPVMEYRTIYL